MGNGHAVFCFAMFLLVSPITSDGSCLENLPLSQRAFQKYVQKCESISNISVSTICGETDLTFLTFVHN